MWFKWKVFKDLKTNLQAEINVERAKNSMDFLAHCGFPDEDTCLLLIGVSKQCNEEEIQKRFQEFGKVKKNIKNFFFRF